MDSESRERWIMKEHQSPWYLFTGLILGLILGVVYAWYISPVEYSNVAPASLSSEYKNAYRKMIALSYAANHDLGRTLGRLALLKDEDVRLALNSQSQQILSAEGSEQEAQALVQLALALNNTSAQMIYTQEAAQLESPPTLEAPAAVETIGSTATVEKAVALTAEPTFTPRPTTASTTEYSLPFVYADSEDVCDPGLSKGLLQIYVSDKSGEGVPAVPITITWDGGKKCSIPACIRSSAWDMPIMKWLLGVFTVSGLGRGESRSLD